MKAQQYRYVVTVTAPGKEQADRVIGERLGPDEDYGFDYRVTWTEEDRAPRST
jgi:hypothetical protein